VSDTRSEVTWPAVTALREQFAAQVLSTAERVRAECDMDSDDVVRHVQTAACGAADAISASLVEAAEMALALWEATT